MTWERGSLWFMYVLSLAGAGLQGGLIYRIGREGTDHPVWMALILTSGIALHTLNAAAFRRHLTVLKQEISQ